MLGLDLSAARLADEERPVRRALVVLPPRHMTAAPDTNSRAPHAFEVSFGRATIIGSSSPIAGRGHSPAITRLPTTCPPRRARAARLLATAAAFPRAATLPCAPDRARAAQADGAHRALADRAAAARPPRRSLLRPVRVRPPARATAAAAAAPPDPRVS